MIPWNQTRLLCFQNMWSNIGVYQRITMVRFFKQSSYLINDETLMLFTTKFINSLVNIVLKAQFNNTLSHVIIIHEVYNQYFHKQFKACISLVIDSKVGTWDYLNRIVYAINISQNNEWISNTICVSVIFLYA